MKNLVTLVININNSILFIFSVIPLVLNINIFAIYLAINISNKSQTPAHPPTSDSMCLRLAMALFATSKNSTAELSRN